MAAASTNVNRARDDFHPTRSAMMYATSTPRPGGSHGSYRGVESGTGLPYAQVAQFDVSNMSSDQKLDYIIRELATVKTLTQQVQHQQAQISSLSETVEQMNLRMVDMEDRASQNEFRIIDLEARSRRNNLVFLNIPELENESDAQTERLLFDFLAGQVKLSEDELRTVVIQRVHRLGRPRRGMAPNGQPFKPRPVIAGFRDFKCRQEILFRASSLKGTEYAIREDFPPEIRTARGRLWEDLKKAKSEKLKAKIVYPAKLIVEGQVVRDMFPGWGQWARGNFAGDQHPRNDQGNIPRAGTPMHIPMADIMQTAPPHMHTPRLTAPSLHPQISPSVYHSPALGPHSVLYGVPATPLHTHNRDIAATPFAAPPMSAQPREQQNMFPLVANEGNQSRADTPSGGGGHGPRRREVGANYDVPGTTETNEPEPEQPQYLGEVLSSAINSTISPVYV